LTLLNSNLQFLELALNFTITVITGVFLFFSHENRSKYYTDFWVESTPIVLWLLYFFTK
jgi:hypothetical protein